LRASDRGRAARAARLGAVAAIPRACDARAMTQRSPTAGGFPIAAGAILGTIGGLVARQPTIGFLAGLGLGVLVAVAIWLKGR
jgi:hypothetical protein